MLLLVSTMFKLRLICTSAYFAINHWSRGQQALNLTQSSQGFTPLASFRPPRSACERLAETAGSRPCYLFAPLLSIRVAAVCPSPCTRPAGNLAGTAGSRHWHPPAFPPAGPSRSKIRHFARLERENVRKMARFVRFTCRKTLLCTDFQQDASPQPPRAIIACHEYDCTGCSHPHLTIRHGARLHRRWPGPALRCLRARLLARLPRMPQPRKPAS